MAGVRPLRHEGAGVGTIDAVIELEFAVPYAPEYGECLSYCLLGGFFGVHVSIIDNTITLEGTRINVATWVGWHVWPPEVLEDQ